jgi:hypothetical protein
VSGLALLAGAVLGTTAFKAWEKAVMEPESPGKQETHRPASASAFRDRHAFAASISTIVKGMTKAEVRVALGKPDDIRPADTHDLRFYPHCEEAWCYGTFGHLGFPTLGSVYFNDSHTVEFVCGGKGTPPPASLCNEVELRRLLSVLDRSSPDFFDPLWAIKAVNTIQQVGKQKALAVVEEFDRIAPPRMYGGADLVFLLLILFEVPKEPGYMPRASGGTFDPKRIPRYPIVIVDDVPLEFLDSLTGGSGQPVSIAKEAQFYREHADILTKPLRPTDQPLQIYRKVFKEYDWLYEEGGKVQAMAVVKSQLGKLLRTVYRGDVENGILPRPIRWDMKRNIYTFLDGTTLPDTSDKEGKKTKSGL